MLQRIKKFDLWLWACVLALSFTGILVMLLLSRQGLSGLEQLIRKQVVFLGAGIALAFFLSFVDYRVFRSSLVFVMAPYVGAVVALAALFLFGTRIQGSLSWFHFGSFSFEPVEPLKVALIILLARYFSLRHTELYHLGHLAVSGFYVAVPVLLILFQPDLGSALLLAVLWVGILMLAGLPLRRLFLLGACGSVLMGIGWFTLFASYQKARVLTFLGVAPDPLGAGYHVEQALLAVGNGGLFGQFRASVSQAGLGFLPEATNDFIFASFAEMFGFLGVLVLLGLLLFLLFRVMRSAFDATNNFSRVYAAGLAVWIFVQSVFHIAMNIGLMPVTGLNLPFMSSGGSSILSLFAALGILESIRLHQPILRETRAEE